MELKEKINNDVKDAMKAGEKLKVSTLRMVLAAIKNAEIEKRDELDPDETITVLNREAKKRREAIPEFKRGGRDDLVERETEELAILEAYLPQQLTDEELESVIRETITEVGAGSPGDIGKVMSKLMPKVRGRADGKKANVLAREILGGE